MLIFILATDGATVIYAFFVTDIAAGLLVTTEKLVNPCQDSLGC
jgi:hypothetical protein